VLGFTQDLFEDTTQLDTSPELAAMMAREMAARFPHLSELAMAVRHDGGLGGCDDDAEFEFGLDLVLDGLEQLRNPRARRRRPDPPPPAGWGGVDPLVARAIDDLRTAARANGSARDQQLLRQVRSTFVELLDSVLHERTPAP
jgi:hypothetical protein